MLRLSRRARALWWSAREVANRVSGQALSHASFAEVLTAELLSALPLEGAGQEEPAGSASLSAPATESPGCGRRFGPVAPLPKSAEAKALESELSEAGAFELDLRLRKGVLVEARHLARVAEALTQVVTLGLHREAGYRSVDAYAEDRLGMARSKARALLRVERASRECPALRAAFVSGRLSWVQAQALLGLLLDPASAHFRTDWVAHAQRVSVRRLRDDVEQALALGTFEPPELEPARPAGLQTGAIPRSRGEEARLFFTASLEVAQLFRGMLAAVQRRIEAVVGRPSTRSEALEAMLEHALAAWQPEKSLSKEYAVFERDGWRCTVPGCTSYRNLQRHHVVFRSQGGSNHPSNLTTLCAWHHLRGVHGHTLRCTGTAPDGLRFELGLREAAPPLLRYGPGDVRSTR